MVLAIGGSSVGEKDLTKGALAKCGNLLFEGINVNVIKRGSVGIVKGKPVVILPGRIVAAVCTFHEHGLHILERMLGVELRRSDDLPLGSDLEVRHKMDSLYLGEHERRESVSAEVGSWTLQRINRGRRLHDPEER